MMTGSSLGSYSRGSFVAAAHPIRASLSTSTTRTDAPLRVRKSKSYTGSLVVRKKTVLDITDFGANLLDALAEFFGRKVGIRLLCVEQTPDIAEDLTSEEATVEAWFLSGSIFGNEDVRFPLKFIVNEDFVAPGALLVRNLHPNEFYLKSIELSPDDGSSENIEFICNSWIYNSSKYESGDRVFFANQHYLPKDTPAGLCKIRQRELENLRGNGTGERKVWDRIYDYDVYNDLGNPDKTDSLSRPTLGGSSSYPYPRRCRTGRPPMKSDKTAESLVGGGQSSYIPADEVFTNTKNSDFLGDTVKAALQNVSPILQRILTLDATFDSFKEVRDLYVEGFDLEKQLMSVNKKRPNGPLTFLSALFSRDDGSLIEYPLPQVIQVDDKAWMKDEEFARQMLSGVNPVTIQQLKEFPPRSKLNNAIYGPELSSIKEEDIKKFMDGKTATQAMQENKLFIMDYHDAYMPHLDLINALPNIRFYASRTLLYLQADGTLMPVAIELSLPPSLTSTPQRVFHPSVSGAKNWLWELAKAHVAANDSGYHQLVSHFLRTHAALEPIIISTHRHISALHPLNPFLIPHYKATLSINAKARQALTNAGGIIEQAFSPGRYSMTLGSAVYKSWRFDEQALPADLIKRGMAIPDPSAKHGMKLVIEDYPYAADGMEIWECIHNWTEEYIDICYEHDTDVASDGELQAWWNEIIMVGHGDKKNETWWVKLNNKKNLVEVLTTIIWLASAHHAAVNFGQYAYAGYMPNHPTCTHREVPKEGSKDYEQLLKNPEDFFLSTVSTKTEATLVMTVIEILSTHASDEEYIGQRATKFWTDNPKVDDAFTRFRKNLKQAESEMQTKNENPLLKNRQGPVKVPYTLLVPRSNPGITGQGIPNSVSI